MAQESAEKTVTQLAPRAFEPGGAEHVRSIHTAHPERGTPFEALLAPHYWAHVSAHMRPRDRVEVYPEDGTYFAELYVLDAGKLFATVDVLRKHEFKANAGKFGTKKHDVRYAGNVDGWRVLRKSDGKVMSKNHATAADAENWALSQERVTGQEAA